MPITDADLIARRKEGQSVRQIAAAIGVNHKRVEYHITRLIHEKRLDRSPRHFGGNFWTPEEVEILLRMKGEGAENDAICAVLRRTEQSVTKKYWHLKGGHGKPPRALAPGHIVGVLEFVPADWDTILDWRTQFCPEARTLREINARRVELGVSPFRATTTYREWRAAA